MPMEHAQTYDEIKRDRSPYSRRSNLVSDGSQNLSVERLMNSVSQNKPQVNHIDGDKTNNHVYNLEWVNNSENVKHSYDIGLQPYRERDTNGQIKRKNHLGECR